MRSVIVNDINYLCIKLEAETQMSVKEILIKVKPRNYCDSTKKICIHFDCSSKDASRLHLIPSQLQRPIMFKDDLKAQEVWPLSELQSQNRWTNAQSLTGMSRIKSLELFCHYTSL